MYYNKGTNILPSYLQGHVRFHTAENCASVLKAMSSPKDELKLEKLTGKVLLKGVVVHRCVNNSVV